MTDDWSARLIHGDCLDVLRDLEAESVDAIVTDPPYGLEFMGKDWDRFAGRELVTRSGHDRASSGAGFGTTADGSPLPTYGGKNTSYECATCGVRDAFRKGCRCPDGETDWRAINPNGKAAAVAFQTFSLLWGELAYRVLKPGGHLLAFGGTRTYHRLAAGLEDAGFEIRDSLHWVYGSGFPKSLDVAKQIDKSAGAEREVVGQRDVPDATKLRPHFAGISNDGDGSPTRTVDVTVPATDEARQWQGWGTALKPAHEPIVLARKPLAGTVAETVLAHGTGALNVGACEIGKGTMRTVPGAKGRESAGVYGDGLNSTPSEFRADVGRWPANVLLGHQADCQGTGPHHTDVLCAPGCPVAELNDASGESTSQGVAQWTGHDRTYGWAESHPSGTIEPQHGTEIGKGDSGGAARFFYIAKPRRRERIGGTIRNLHPTVKPIDLMRHLVRLVTPPGGVVLDPFLGSGTTGCAAMIEGLRFVGVELESESFETSHARISDYAFAHDRAAPTTEKLDVA